MYPQLWNLRALQSGRQKFHVSPDLRFPSVPPSKAYEAECIILNDQLHKEKTAKRRTLSLICYLLSSRHSLAMTSQAITDCLGSWIMQNVHGAFEYSIAISVKQWDLVKEGLVCSRDVPNRHEKNKQLLEKFRTGILVNRHQMEKAYEEIGASMDGIASFNKEGKPTDSQQKYFSQQWHRSSRSQLWLLEEIDQAMRSVQSELQLELASTQLEESRKAIQQTETVKRLTALAFVFIPISAVSSAFGMNVRELNEHLPPIWIFLAVALCVTATTLLCSLRETHDTFWAFLAGCKRLGLAWVSSYHVVINGLSEPKASMPAEAVNIGVDLASTAVGFNLPRALQTSGRERSSSFWQRLYGNALRTVSQVFLAPVRIVLAPASGPRGTRRNGTLQTRSKELG